jgi:hypothetical protein
MPHGTAGSSATQLGAIPGWAEWAEVYTSKAEK